MSKNLSVSVQCVIHWLYERECEDCNPDEVRYTVGSYEDYERELAPDIVEMEAKDSPLWMALYSEYSRQHPYFDGKWWEDGRTYKQRKGSEVQIWQV